MKIRVRGFYIVTFKELMAFIKEGTAEEQATLRERCEKDFA